MKDSEFTSYCGLYCPDCVHFRNNHSPVAYQLKKELGRADFFKYSSVKSPLVPEYEDFDKFIAVLDRLIAHQCRYGCRKVGSCIYSGGEPCPIVRCCQEKGYAGCWECESFRDCEKFDVIRKFCGESNVKNLELIKVYGPEKWVEKRHPFYRWD